MDIDMNVEVDVAADRRLNVSSIKTYQALFMRRQSHKNMTSSGGLEIDAGDDGEPVSVQYPNGSIVVRCGNRCVVLGGDRQIYVSGGATGWHRWD